MIDRWLTVDESDEPRGTFERLLFISYLFIKRGGGRMLTRT